MHNSDDFAFDQEMLIQAVHFGLVLGDIPVPVRYFPEASSISWKRSMRYGADTVSTMGSRYLHKMRMRADPRFMPPSTLLQSVGDPDKRESR